MDRPSQRPTLRAPAAAPPRGHRDVALVATGCGLLLLSGLVLRLFGPEPPMRSEPRPAIPRAAPPALVSDAALAPPPRAAPSSLEPPPPPATPAAAAEPPARVVRRDRRPRPAARVHDEIPSSTFVEPNRVRIGSIIQRQQASLRSCYLAATDRAGIARASRIDLTVEIAPSGDLEALAVAGTDRLPGMDACVRRVAEGWRFPSSTHGATAPVVLLFRPSDA